MLETFAGSLDNDGSGIGRRERYFRNVSGGHFYPPAAGFIVCKSCPWPPNISRGLCRGTAKLRAPRGPERSKSLVSQFRSVSHFLSSE
ncbi:unnamed protein product, partial [Iphiclides podalirius]